MQGISIFKNDNFGEVRVAGTSEEPLFCLADVCKAISIVNARNVRERLEEEDVRLVDTLTPGGTQKITYVTESGLYDVIIRSDSERAKPFRRWVTSEVIPSIRKDGIYATDSVIDQILENPDYGIALLTKLKEERTARVEAERQVAILTHVNKTYTATEVAKEIGMKSVVKLNNRLKELGIQYKVNGTWVPYQKYAELGWFDIKQEVMDNGHIIYHRRITGTGRKAIIGLVS